ncbi:methyltransferase domain-containing protein [Enterococcus asini]|uniref:methyltransferase domain-containing protein n=2 Tax=Enterococcus TaxID=1350 RepID=UPI00288D0861|nr:methyltransferase domain-containing protein [Enterococcus asini]MDT2755981.1 methyltransferase domain-containing protein [Enterococcus asini]
MKKKIERGQEFVASEAELFACPICHENMLADHRGLICPNNHRFDVSKKGTLFFLQHQVKTEYDEEMFRARRKLIQGGMYAPLLKQLAQWLPNKGTLLDVGCGEGSFLDLLLAERPQKTGIGFDISKAGVYMATDLNPTAFWCVADLTNLPFRKASFDTVLNIFSPSNYQEFARILKPEGQLLKVVPGPKYLQELRQAFFPDDVNKQQYSNRLVQEKFTEAYLYTEEQKITYEFDIPKELQLDLLEMSPLEWSAEAVQKEKLKKHPLEKITIDLLLLRGKNSPFCEEFMI